MIIPLYFKNNRYSYVPPSKVLYFECEIKLALLRIKYKCNEKQLAFLEKKMPSILPFMDEGQIEFYSKRYGY